eukprot:m.372986 g.372986  ORF g.372986 m.372986 type:complete len:459 (+) comp20882_c1_seq2:167-1543(+)
MMTCNSPTPYNVPRSIPPSPSGNKLDDSLASISHMIGLSPGIVKPLCSDSMPGTFEASTRDTVAGSAEYWQKLEQMVSDSSPVHAQRRASAPALASSAVNGYGQQFVPQSPTHTRGSPVPVKGNVPIQHGNNTGFTPIHQQQAHHQILGIPSMEKPPYSFPCLIGLALQNSKTGRMSVSQIYEYIVYHFPYFRTAKSGWKNSVRHNLSLNKFFCKLERRDDEAGKGSMWGIVPENREQLARDITVCRNRFPSKLRSMSVGSQQHMMQSHQQMGQQHMYQQQPLQPLHEQYGAAQQQHPQQRFVPASPTPKQQFGQQPPYLNSRTNSAPMINTGPLFLPQPDSSGLDFDFANVRSSKRMSLPGNVVDADMNIDFFSDLDDVTASICDVDMMSDVSWMGETPSEAGNDGSGGSSSGAGLLDMIDEDASWQSYLPDDVSSFMDTPGSDAPTDSWDHIKLGC